MEVTLAAFQKRYQYKAPADLIGKGGFSDVYKAWDTQDEQFVALKIATASAGEKYDLTNEVKKVKKLKHPNLIEYYDLYEVSTGTKDIHGHDLNYQVAVMEYAEGGTLGDLLKNKPLTNTEAEELAEGIIDGLAYLHTNNITHRDLKPANILLTTKNGKRIPKITDFGLAKSTAAGNTASTMLVGTVEYMAPEFFKQAEGETTTAAADVWSIGVILLEALTGIHPFGKTTQGKSNEQIIYNILSADRNPSLQNLRAPFKELISRCLIREPKLRPQTAEELKGLLQNAPNDFSERTQIIDYKPQAKNVITTEPKWKKWGKALFDFDLRNGKWKRVFLREILIGIIFMVALIITLVGVASISYSSAKKESKNKLEGYIQEYYEKLAKLPDLPGSKSPSLEDFKAQYETCEGCFKLAQGQFGNDLKRWNNVCRNFCNSKTFLHHIEIQTTQFLDKFFRNVFSAIFIYLLFPIRWAVAIFIWGVSGFNSTKQNRSKSIAREIILLITSGIIAVGIFGLSEWIYSLRVQKIGSESFAVYEKLDSLLELNHPIVNIFYQVSSHEVYNGSFEQFCELMKEEPQAEKLYYVFFPAPPEEESISQILIQYTIIKSFRVPRNEITVDFFYNKINIPEFTPTENSKRALSLIEDYKRIEKSKLEVYHPSILEATFLSLLLLFPLRYIVAILLWALRTLKKS